MTAWTVRIEPADPGRAAAAAAALATLPVSYVEAGGADVGAGGPHAEVGGSPAAGGDAEVVVVAGSEGWVGRVRAAAAAGARGVIVTDPLPLPAAATLAADAPACLVVLAETWASSPALRSAAEQFATPIARTRLIDVRTVETIAGRDLRTALFAELRAVQRLGIEVASLAIVAETPSSILGVGRSASGARIVLSAARSAAADGSLDLLLVAPDETIRIELPDGTTARPGRAVLTSASAAVEIPTTWQTAHRTAWLKLSDALLSGAEPGQLEQFATATALLTRAGASGDPAD